MAKEGLYIPIAQGELAPKSWMEFGNAERLGQFDGRYRFFTPALLYLRGEFNDAPLIEFLCACKKQIRFYHHRFQRPIFKGLEATNGNGDWNYVLWAIESDVWPEFEMFMLSVTMWDPRVKVVYRVGSKDMSIADPLFMDKAVMVPPRPPRIDVVGFGVDSSMFALSFVEGPPPFCAPTAKAFPPIAHSKDVAKALREGNDPNLPLPTVMPPETTPPVQLRVRGIQDVNPVRQADYLRAIAQFKKDNPT